MYASSIAQLIPVLMHYSKKGFGEEVNVIGSREQKKLQRTASSSWLVSDAVLDCSHLLQIVAITIAHLMLANASLTPQCCAFV